MCADTNMRARAHTQDKYMHAQTHTHTNRTSKPTYILAKSDKLLFFCCVEVTARTHTHTHTHTHAHKCALTLTHAPTYDS
mmetsp:Transcript_39233/g.96941  ORF Transcript_39233/g.96941 Transcript_39233/m.96941 type:complete len:80 (+) Transcript_39233:46-285(+)